MKRRYHAYMTVPFKQGQGEAVRKLAVREAMGLVLKAQKKNAVAIAIRSISRVKASERPSTEVQK